jgi:VWFA-related protein
LAAKWGWIALVLCTALPAFSAEHISVAQLEDLLAQSQSLSDADLALKLSNLQLTEHLSSARLAHWRTAQTGAKTQRALLGLADRSAFLALPAADIAGKATPDLAEQRRILALAARYVSSAIPRLPRFSASRTTVHFEDVPGSAGDAMEGGSLRAVRMTKTTVRYQDGQEIAEPGPLKASKSKNSDQGLRTWGAFGPVLGLVLVDAAQNRLAWGHWEQGDAGPLAVFRYSVPREKSHYEVRYCCVAEAYGMQSNSFTVMSGYHGEIAVDPASGIIVRVTLQAELNPSDPISRADLAVEYGPVQLGGTTYTCPQHSVSISMARTIRQLQDPSGHSWPAMGPVQMLLNHVDFDQYHLFRADTRVLSGDEERRAALAPDATLPLAKAPVDVEPSEEELADFPAAKPAQNAGKAVRGLNPVASSDDKAPAGEAPAGEAPEISAEEATALPDGPAQSEEQASNVRFRINARLVDVNVVALDKKGRPISGLKPGDFEIYDNGVKQNVRSFSRANMESASAPEVVQAVSKEGTFSNHSAKDAQPSNAESNTIILLVDGSNLALVDFAQARQQIVEFLQKLPANQRVALYAMRYHGYQVLEEATADHEAIAGRLKTWMPIAQDMNNARDEEQRNRQQIETVHSPEDMLNVNGNYTMDSGTQTEALDPKLRELGSQPGAIAMALLTEVARHLSSIPGHKSLVWVTSDNVLADWNKASITIEKGSKYIEPVALRTQEAMNNAHVSVYPLDASHLEAAVINADIGRRNVELTETFQKPPLIERAQEGTEATAGQDPNPYIQNRQFGTNGRLLAQMEQDLHPIQGVFREVADATGGRTFGRSNNMIGQLNSVAAEGNATYLLSFTPSEAADGKYHLLSVKVVDRKDVRLRYRTGYKYDKEATSLKDRFQEAMWQSFDASEIGLSTKAIVDAAGKALRVTVNGEDLDMAKLDTPQYSLWTGKLDIFLVQRDAVGEHAKVTGQTVGLRLKPGTYQHAMTEGLTFDERIDSKLTGGGSLRVVVVDVNSGRLGSVTVPSTAFQQ